MAQDVEIHRPHWFGHIVRMEPDETEVTASREIREQTSEKASTYKTEGITKTCVPASLTLAFALTFALAYEPAFILIAETNGVSSLLIENEEVHSHSLHLMHALCCFEMRRPFFQIKSKKKCETRLICYL